MTSSRRSLPHWRIEGGVYFVTFRLDDSLPQEIVAEYRRESQWLAGGGGDPRDLTRLYCQRIDRALDAGTGTCPFAQPELAGIVQEALRHFDGDRYSLYAFCVMPNHVHAVVRPGTATLAKILHTWKSYTASYVNQRLGRRGTFWQHESFDHLIRNVADLHRFCRYTFENSDKAGLTDWPWRYVAPNLPNEDW